MSSSLSSAHSNISGLDIVATHLLRSREHADRPKSRTRSAKILKSKFRTFFLVVLSLLLAAQTHRGSLRGTIYDPNQAVIPGATVTVTSVATGEVRTTTTNHTGDYTISSLAAGAYQVEVEESSFQKYFENLETLVNQAPRVTATLHPSGPDVSLI